MSYELLSTLQVTGVGWRNKIHGPRPGRCNLYFTPEWAKRGYEWCGGKYFEIVRSITVPYSRTAIIPADDYIDFNLSNVDDRGAVKGVKLYPEAQGRVHEILIGFKPGNYLIIPGIPSGKEFLLALSDTTMYPDIADADRKYMAFQPEDSPEEDPNINLWAIKDYDAWTLRCYVLDGVGHEKITVSFKVVKHEVKELVKPPETFTEVKHHSEIAGLW